MDWNNLQDVRLAVITELVSRAPSGHVGRTALVKLCYFLQTVRKVPLGYRFTLYSYGPFDSNVLADLGSAENVHAVQSKIVSYPGGYGYEISPGERGDSARLIGKEFLDQHHDDINWVLKEFGAHSSADLELESTIVYVDREAARNSQPQSIEILAQRVRDVKPRFKEEYIQGKAAQLQDKGLLMSTSAIPAAAC